MHRLIHQLLRRPSDFMEFCLDDEFTIKEKADTVIDNITYPVRYLYKKITHVLSWLPTLWRDEDWDSQYLMIMMSKKLTNMASYSEKQGHLKDSAQQAKEMKYAAHILQRFIDDVHCEHALDTYYKAHPIEWLESTNEKGWHTMQLVISDTDRRRCKKIMESKDKMQKLELLKLFDLMRRRIQHWWD